MLRMAAVLQEMHPPMTQRVSRALVVDDHPIVADALVTAMHSMKVFDRIEVASSL